MKPLFSFLLVLSLLGNGWLAYRYVTAPATQPAIAADGPSSDSQSNRAPGNTDANAQTSAIPTPHSVPMVWTQPGTSDDDLRSLAERLRAAGFPKSTIQAITQHRVRQRDYAPLAQIPFWNLKNPNPATRTALLAAERTVADSMVNILGPDGTPAALLSAPERTRRFGQLSEEKINAVLELQNDYREVSANMESANSRPMTSEEVRTRTEQRRALDTESNADLAQILTPAELAHYELRSSPAANAVMNNLSNTTVSEEEYQALVLLQKNYASGHGGIPTFAASTPEERAQLSEQRLNYNEQLRETLGEERFYSYLAKSDFEFGQVASFAAKKSTLTPTVTYELYKLATEAQRTLLNLSPRPTESRDPETVRALMRARDTAQQDLNQRLDTLLGAELAAAYREEGNARLYFAQPQPPANRPPTN
jgi:hypothetical protein